MRHIALLAGLLLTGSACTLTGPTTQIPPGVAQVTPTESPNTSPTQSQAASPSQAAGLAIGSLALHDGEVGLGYSPVTFGVSGGVGPYAWAISSGNFPPGLLLGSNGVVSGTPSGAGHFNFSVQVTDSKGNVASNPAAATVFSAMNVSQPCANKCAIGVGCVKCGGFGMVGGGAPPYLYRIVGGAVPPGMRYSGLGLSGPFPAGQYSLSVQVNDSLGAEVAVRANWVIYGAATLNSGGNCTGFGNTAPQSCTVRWTYSGGSSSAVPQVVVEKVCLPTGACGAPPANMPDSFSAKGAGGVITITAATSVACNAPPYQATLTLALKDTAACATTALSAPADLTINLSNSC